MAVYTERRVDYCAQEFRQNGRIPLIPDVINIPNVASSYKKSSFTFRLYFGRSALLQFGDNEPTPHFMRLYGRSVGTSLGLHRHQTSPQKYGDIKMYALRWIRTSDPSIPAILFRTQPSQHSHCTHGYQESKTDKNKAFCTAAANVPTGINTRESQ